MTTKVTERRPTARPASDLEYSGTEETAWGDVDKGLAAFVAAYGTEAEQGAAVPDLSDSTKAAIAARTILGDATAESADDLIAVPVVNPATNRLNRGALNAARAAAGGARGADLPDADGIMAVTGTLLSDEFDVEESALDRRSANEQEERSFEDVRELLRQALIELERPGDNWLYVEAVYDDRVVYEISGTGGLWQRAYTISDEDEVEFGERTKVARRTTFEPVGESGPVRESHHTTHRADLIERWADGEVLAEARVDRRQNLISNVVLLGRRSRNGRVYTDTAMQEAAELYRGVKFFIDHPTKSEEKNTGGVRSVHDLAGRVLNPRVVGEQVRGDLELLDREPTKSLVFSLAEQMPEVVGNSHRARGEIFVNDEGIEVVESVTDVFGMELVTEPATTDGLLESIQRQGDGDMKIEDLTLEQIKQSRPDIVRSLISEQERSEAFDSLKEQVEKLEPRAKQADDLEEKVATLEEQVETVTAERDDLNEKVADLEEKEQKRERTDLVRQKLKAADLGRDDVPKTFFEQMMNAEDEAGVEAIVEAIVEIAGERRPAGRSYGGPRLVERDPDDDVRESRRGRKKLTESEVERAYDEMWA